MVLNLSHPGPGEDSCNRRETALRGLGEEAGERGHKYSGQHSRECSVVFQQKSPPLPRWAALWRETGGSRWVLGKGPHRGGAPISGAALLATSLLQPQIPLPCPWPIPPYSPVLDLGEHGREDSITLDDEHCRGQHNLDGRTMVQY